MGKYQPTIGLEIHAILKTRTKMFCDTPNPAMLGAEEQEPNKFTCPVCMGHPGCLPAINKEAVKLVIKTGLALGGTINKITKFDRKNYFYPDLPKGYQISQYDQPLVLGGELRKVHIRRIHLEEDAGRLLHDIAADQRGSSAEQRGKIQRESAPGQRGSASFVDYNRAGVPLMELVTEPDLRSGEETVEFARELQRILRALKVSDADMEKGQMRIEANVSLDMGPKVELKNINSFKAVGSAIAYEIKRQAEILDGGGTVVHETRGWDDGGQKTYSQRSKEEAHDYRYFPEPDLPPLDTSEFDIELLRKELPEMPAEKKERLKREFGLSDKQADIFIDEPSLSDFFEAAVSELKEMDPKADPTTIYNYLTTDLKGLMSEKGEELRDIKIDPEHLAHLAFLIGSGKIMSRQAKDILAKMYVSGEDAEDIMMAEGLETVSDEGEILKTVREIIAENPKAAEDYKKGKEASLQFLVGKAMAKLRGRGDPGRLRQLFKKELS